MNEVEFRALARGFQTGAAVLFLDRLVEHGRETEGREDLLRGARQAVAAGVVLRFVDPAKPLLVYRRPKAGTTGIDFFQDVLYAAEPAIRSQAFRLYPPQTDGDRTGREADNAESWVRHLEEMVGLPLLGETPMFEAYSKGAFGGSYADPTAEPAASRAGASYPTAEPAASRAGAAGEELAAWLEANLRLLGLEAENMTLEKSYNVWENHDVYEFS
ncbi:MAG: hypothetical protein ACOC28_00420 [Alkalispirochaetaceae bacterium]